MASWLFVGGLEASARQDGMNGGLRAVVAGDLDAEEESEPFFLPIKTISMGIAVLPTT